MNKNLLFFNNDGYPYNFQWNNDNEYYEGKIFFDENSSDTFKTIDMYIFEEVNPIEFVQEVTLNKVELYNESGITFNPFTNSGSTITNISRVNSDSEFYSKWIFGNNFDKLYPKGTIVSFDNINFTDNFGTPVSISDFNKQYYTILENKPNAVLVNTVTKNSLWSYLYVTGGTINSHNIIKFNDYNDNIIPTVEGFTFHENKKLNVIDSVYNTGIKTYVDSGLTNTYHKTYDISTFTTGDTMKIDIELFTERPKIYQGEVSFNISGTTAILDFHRGFNSFFNIEEGQSFIFEDYNDNPILPNNPVFTIIDGAGEFYLYDGEVDFYNEININKTILRHFNSKDLSSINFVNNYNKTYIEQNIDSLVSQYPINWWEYDNYIEIKSNLLYDIQKDDIIQLSATTINSSAKNENRKYTVEKYLSFRDIRISYWTQQINSDLSWLSSVKSKAITNNLTLPEQILIEATYMYDTNDNDINSKYYISPSNRYNKIKVKEYVINEDTTNEYNIKKIISLENSKTLICNILPNSNTAFTMNVIAYDTINILTLEQTILPSIEDSINAFNIKYESILNDYGLYIFYDDILHVHSKWSTNIDENYFDINLYKNGVEVIGSTQFEVNTLYLEVNELLKSEEYLLSDKTNFVNNYHAEIQFDLQNNNTSLGFVLMVSDNEYYIKFSGNTQSTIENFISTYTTSFNSIGVNLSLSGTNILVLDGQFPNINLYSLSAKVNSFSSYEILKEEIGAGIFITGHEIELPNNLSYTFYDIGLSTGMILSINEYETSTASTLLNKEYNIIGLTPTIIELSYQGPFLGGVHTLLMRTQRFLRKPRESYDKDVYYSFRWEFPDDEDAIYRTHDIFMYDFSGEHLKPYENDTKLTYTGTKPLWDNTNICSLQNEQIYLRDEPNKNLDWINDPTKQQTVFRGKDGEYMLEFLLDQYDSSNEYDFTPEPLQVFIGFNSQDEGVSKAVLLIDKVENINFSGYTNSIDYQTNIDFEFTINGELIIQTKQVNFNFHDYGFEINQDIDIKFDDLKPTGNTIFENYGPFRIKTISGNKIIIDTDKLNYTIIPFTTTGNTHSFEFEIKTLPRTISRIELYGETEIEDERYEIALNNLGIHIGYDEEHIFMESDIKEHGYDYILLNAKRKEMLSIYPEIYNYVGSYKAVINAINFFGWNDLELNEYYKNININSPLYQKLHRVRIPDIFDNTIKGWTSNDWIEGKYQSGNWKKTNLFNLSYRITDEEGNNILLYSLDEVQIKLNKLKRWLKRYMLPLSTNLIDITGVAEVDCNNYQQYDVSNLAIKSYSENDVSVVNFNYTSTLNFDTNYLLQINFYTLDGSTPSGWTGKIKTFYKSTDGTNKLIPQKYYKILKNDLEPFSFNIDINVDEYLYIETEYFNEFGIGQKYNKMINTSTTRKYLLVNNNFNIPKNYTNRYINTGTNMNGIYYFDENGYIYLDD